MTPHDLLANFEVLAEAPNGIQRLRELVLELAVRGKLVEQDPGDESADELLKLLKAEKTRFIASGVIRGGKHLPDVGPDEKSFKLPPTWRWSRLRSISRDLGQKVPDVPFSYIDVGSIDNQRGRITEFPEVLDPAAAPSRARKLVALGTVIFSTVRPYLMNIAVVAKRYEPTPIVSTAFAVLHPFQGIDSTFLYWVLRSPFFMNWVADRAKGVAYPAISDGDLQMAPVPVPPVAEQRRIVTRVDELMALLDRLEAKRQEREAARAAARDSALAALREAPTPDDVENAWLRIQERFHELFATPGDVESLRQAILQLAVRGRLLAQSLEDTPAYALVDEIRRLRGTRSKSKQASLQSTKIPSFSLPNGWTWCHLQDVGMLDRGRSRHRPRNDRKLYEGGTIPMVQTGDIARAKGAVRTYSYLYNEFGLAQSRLWPSGTLCITIAANIADTAILGIDACFPDSVVGFIPDAPIPNAQYFDIFIRTAKSNLEEFAPSTAQKNINLGILEELWVPLPPLNEMERIVDLVEIMLRRCESLEKTLRNVQSLASDLTSAAIHHLDA